MSDDDIKKAAAILGKKGGLIGGKAKTEKKAASSRENGKLGGRPRKIITDHFSTYAMKNGEMYILQINDDSVRGRGEPNKYRLMICHPGGGQIDAEYQPANDGSMPDIQLLAEENGFEVIDIFDMRDYAQKK